MAWRAGVWGAAMLVGLLGPVVEAGLGLPGTVVLAQSTEEQRTKAIRLSNEEMLLIGQAVEEQFSEVLRLNNEGQKLQLQGKWQAALRKYEQALDIVRRIEDRKSEGILINKIGRIYKNLSQYEKALGYYQQAFEIAQEAGDRKGEGDSLNNIGSTYENLAQYQKALDYYQRSLTLQREAKDRKGESVVLNNIGGIYKSLAQYNRALGYYQQSLEIAQEVGDRKGEGITLNNIGSIYDALSQYEKALIFYEQSLEIRQEVGDKKGESVTLNNIASIYDNLGQYGNSLDYHQQSLAVRQGIGDRQGEGISFNNIGNVYGDLGQYRKALGYHQRSLSIRQEIGDRQGEGISFNNIGNTHKGLGQYEQALIYYQRSLELQQEIGDRKGEGISLSNTALIYEILGQHEKSLIHYQQSLELQQEIGNRQGEGVSLNNIGSTYASLGQDDNALRYYQRALAIQREIGDRDGAGRTLNNIAFTFNDQSRAQLAILFFKQSISTFESIRAGIEELPVQQRRSYTGTVEPTYRKLADLLLQQERILEAQQVLDLLKVQELEDYLRNTRSSDSNDLIILKPEQEILDRYQQLQTSAIQTGQELTQLRQLKAQQNLAPQQDQRLQELLNLEQDINRQFNAFIDSDPIQTLLDQLSRQTLQQTLPLEDLNALRDNLRQTNAALIYPLILEDRLELILTTPDSPPIRRTVQNFDAQKLRETIVAYRNALQSPNNLEGTKQLAQQLHDWLITPLEADLAAANPDTLIYAPDGILRYIPLAALYDKNQPDGKQWLGQRYATNNIVAKSLTEFDSTPTDNPRVLAAAWGNQSHSIKAGDKTFNFSGIPFTLSEVESLAQLLPTEALLEQDFSRSNLTAKDLNSFNIIHLATHGKFVTGNAANSFLALGSGEAIPLPEIKNLSLSDVDLVVLSACETGVGGDFGQGEEILGLGYQFQRAGAKAALASLWQVDDGGTQQLMNAFYAGLNQGMTKAAALQTAQQALISGDYEAVDIKRAGVTVASTRTGEVISDRQLSHPYYWAPFILIGNGL